MHRVIYFKHSCLLVLMIMVNGYLLAFQSAVFKQINIKSIGKKKCGQKKLLMEEVS